MRRDSQKQEKGNCSRSLCRALCWSPSPLSWPSSACTLCEPGGPDREGPVQQRPHGRRPRGGAGFCGRGRGGCEGRRHGLAAGVRRRGLPGSGEPARAGGRGLVVVAGPGPRSERGGRDGFGQTDLSREHPQSPAANQHIIYLSRRVEGTFRRRSAGRAEPVLRRTCRSVRRHTRTGGRAGSAGAGYSRRDRCGASPEAVEAPSRCRLDRRPGCNRCDGRCAPEASVGGRTAVLAALHVHGSVHDPYVGTRLARRGTCR